MKSPPPRRPKLTRNFELKYYDSEGLVIFYALRAKLSAKNKILFVKFKTMTSRLPDESQ